VTSFKRTWKWKNTKNILDIIYRDGFIIELIGGFNRSVVIVFSRNKMHYNSVAPIRVRWFRFQAQHEFSPSHIFYRFINNKKNLYSWIADFIPFYFIEGPKTAFNFYTISINMFNEIQEIQIKTKLSHNIIKNLILLGTYYKYKTIILNFLQTN